MDIVGISESHLLPRQSLAFDEYEWFGNNRKDVHHRAWSGSGGVGFMVKKDLFQYYKIHTLDDSYEGILWISLQCKQSGTLLNGCVCYMPPEGTSRYVDPHDFLNTLTSQIYMYQNNGLFFIGGDFNGRCGQNDDFIAGVDTVPGRHVVDFQENSHGDLLLEFMTTVNCIMLNGRNDSEEINGFTYYGPHGQSVVDYVMISHDRLDMFSGLKVTAPRQVFQEAGLVGVFDPSQPGILCDHALLSFTWDLSNVLSQESIHSGTFENSSYVKYNVADLPNDFMQNNEMLQLINDRIERMENIQNAQTSIDELYQDFCDEVKQEMNRKLSKKVIVINNGSSNRRRKVMKPWWSDHLSVLWNKLCNAERIWRKSVGQVKKRRKAEMSQMQREFDRNVQKAKRAFWRQQQESLLSLQREHSKDFWKRIGKLGVASEREKNIPWEIVNDDGTVSHDQGEVLQKWASDFSQLLNPANDANGDMDVNHSAARQNVIEAGINDPITRQELLRMLVKAKNGKSSGYDEIPTEVLRNDAAKEYMLKLFNMCFHNGIVPSMWLYGIVSPIPKNATCDPRVPLNYRGIVLAAAMYKLYCGILNHRLQFWADVNNAIEDEQNGFRPERSCIDQLSCFTNIIECRKVARKSTYVAFVDFSKAYDRVNREILWDKLVSLGVHGKMLLAIQSIYKDVNYCVRVNGVRSDWFSVTTGLRQGCILSPLLFNLYINDLAQILKQMNIGVTIDTGEKVPLLLYADDLCLLAESEIQLQQMLDTLHGWCVRNRMAVNTGKTKVVHFRPPSILRTDYHFMCGGAPIEITDKYKYLGLVISEHLDYNITAKMVAQAAGRALGLLIAKDKAHGGMPYQCFTKLYDALVQPVINYGAAIWGTKEYSCIAAIQNRACRYYMGLGKYAPNVALEGDMGWFNHEHHLWISVTRLWCRLVNMNNNRLNKRVFLWADRLNRKNWCSRVKNFFMDRHMPHLCDTSQSVIQRQVVTEVSDVLKVHFTQVWWQKLMRQEAIRGGRGRNKLRTYRLFKQEKYTEPYLLKVYNKKHRSALAKFRSGVAPLLIETGRYSNTPEAERVCFNCPNDIENELHVLLRCPIYNDLRDEMFVTAAHVCYDFNEMSENEKLCFLLKLRYRFIMGIIC